MTRTATLFAAAALAFGCAAVPTTAEAGVAHVEAFDTYGGHVYAFVSTSMTFDDAQDACDDLGMDLVTINSLHEQDWLVERTFVATPANAYSGYLNTWIWIGAYNDDIDGQDDVYSAMVSPDWQWISGECSSVRLRRLDGHRQLELRQLRRRGHHHRALHHWAIRLGPRVAHQPGQLPPRLCV